MQHKAVYLLFCKFTLHVSGVKPRPSPGVHKTVTTASGTVQLPPSNVAKLGLAWPRWNYIIVQRDSTQSSLLFCKFNLHNSGVKPRPSPGVHKTVTTASGTVQLPPFVAKLGLAWPRWNYITVQRDATQSILYIILEVHSSCFVCQPHPLSGVHKTVTTASGTGHIICAATSLQRGQLGHAGGR